jgi:hypothetical protein
MNNYGRSVIGAGSAGCFRGNPRDFDRNLRGH